MRRGLLIVGVMLMCAGNAWAQEDDSRAEVSAGWRYYHAEIATFTPGFQPTPLNDFYKGWYADVALNLSPKFAVVGDVGGFYEDTESRSGSSIVSIEQSADYKLHTFMGGVRVRAPQHRAAVPFGQVLVGGQHNTVHNARTITISGRPTTTEGSTGSSGAVLALDGGVTIVGVRASVGYARMFGTTDTDALRVSVGGAFRF